MGVLIFYFPETQTRSRIWIHATGLQHLLFMERLMGTAFAPHHSKFSMIGFQVLAFQPVSSHRGNMPALMTIWLVVTVTIKTIQMQTSHNTVGQCPQKPAQVRALLRPLLQPHQPHPLLQLKKVFSESFYMAQIRFHLHQLLVL